MATATPLRLTEIYQDFRTPWVLSFELIYNQSLSEDCKRVDLRLWPRLRENKMCIDNTLELLSMPNSVRRNSILVLVDYRVSIVIEKVVLFFPGQNRS